MEDTDTLQILPPNFISLQKLQELRLKEKQQKEKETQQQLQQQDEEIQKRLAEVERGKLVVVGDEITNTTPTRGFYKKKKKKNWVSRPKLEEQKLENTSKEPADLEELKHNMKSKKKKMKKKKNTREKEGELMEEKQTVVVESTAEVPRSFNPTVEVALDKEKPKSNGWQKKKTAYRNPSSSESIANSGDFSGNKRNSRSTIQVMNRGFVNAQRKGGENLMWVKKEGIKSDSVNGV